MIREIEKSIPVPGTDLRIYGTLREVEGAPVVVICHGLGGSRNDLLPYTASHYLSERGFTTFRFDFYGAELDARNLVDLTIEDHVTDFNLVISTLKAEVPNRPIFAAGHSLGGLVIVLANNDDIASASLWEASHTAFWSTAELEDDYTLWDDSIGMFRLRWGIDLLVTRKFLESYRYLDCDELARAFSKPALVLLGEASNPEALGRYYELAPQSKKLVVLSNADHNFTTGNSMPALLKETEDWLLQ